MDETPEIDQATYERLDAGPERSNAIRAMLIKHNPDWSDHIPFNGPWPPGTPLNSDGIPILEITDDWPADYRGTEE